MVSDYDEARSEEELDGEEIEESEIENHSEGAVFDTRGPNSQFSQSEALEVEGEEEDDEQGAEDSYNKDSSLAPSSTGAIGKTPSSRNRATQELLEWRRQKSFELFLTGKSPSQISRILQVSLRTVERDLEYMKSNAKETMRKYFTHTLPEQVLASIARLNYLNARAFDIAERAREKGQGKLEVDSLRLAKEISIALSDLALNNKSLIDSAYDIADANKGVERLDKRLNDDDIDTPPIIVPNDTDDDIVEEGREEGSSSSGGSGSL
jgi:hypothetical protein